MSNGTSIWNYSYDAGGMRTSRTDGIFNYTYVYNGDLLMRMTINDNVLEFAYDASGTPMTVTLDGVTYYYLTNIQGDVVSIVDANGVSVVRYAYDAWGYILSMDGSLKNTLGRYNPLRYRGYVYDECVGLYYLQSRYYSPQTGRFLNADGYISTGQGILSNNMFVYCGNNPINAYDPSGETTIWYYLIKSHQPGFIHACVQNHIIASYGYRPLRKEFSVPGGRADIVDMNTLEVWEIKHGKSAAYFEERTNHAFYQAARYLEVSYMKELGAANAFSGSFVVNCLGQSYSVSYNTPARGVVLYTVDELKNYEPNYDYKFVPDRQALPDTILSSSPQYSYSFTPNYTMDAMGMGTFTVGMMGVLMLLGCLFLV